MNARTVEETVIQMVNAKLAFTAFTEAQVTLVQKGAETLVQKGALAHRMAITITVTYSNFMLASSQLVIIY